MSYSTEMATNFGSVFASYAAMAEPDETECLDFQSKMTTSTSSTIVPMLEDTAGTSGGSKLADARKTKYFIIHESSYEFTIIKSNEG